MKTECFKKNSITLATNINNIFVFILIHHVLTKQSAKALNMCFDLKMMFFKSIQFKKQIFFHLLCYKSVL